MTNTPKELSAEERLNRIIEMYDIEDISFFKQLIIEEIDCRLQLSFLPSVGFTRQETNLAFESVAKVAEKIRALQIPMEEK